MTPMLGFSPDVDAATPGVLTDCTNYIPYVNGMEGGPSATTPSDVPALAAACLGAAVVANLAGTRRILAGTTTKLYELSGGAWDDIGRAAAYTGGSDTRWVFAQFGNTTLATNRADEMQRSTAAGVDFANIASAPKAEIIFSVGTQIMALNVNDGAEKPDGWHVCALNDETDWTTSLTTQAASGRLVSTPGAITAGARLGEYAVAYKAKSLYIGRYVDAPDIWDWKPVHGSDSGCVGKEALCEIVTPTGPAHFFVGDDNFCVFDGTRPIPIGDAVRQWFYDNSSPQYRYRTKCVFDRQNNRVWVFYPSASASSCDSALVYHVKTKQWGRSDRTIEAALNYIASGLTFNTWDSAGATYDALPNIAFDSQFWLAGGQALATFNSSHQLQNLTGASTSSGFTTGDVGDDDQYSLLTGIRLRFAPGYKPTTASVQTFHKATSGDGYTTGPTAALSDGRFDVLVEDRWHKASFTFSGAVRVTAGKPMLDMGGER
jgi:hypothetical protein